MRRFIIERDEDVSGMSGTGNIAEGVRFSNGKAVMIWLTALRSVNFYESVDDLIAIHGHAGATRLVWLDD